MSDSDSGAPSARFTFINQHTPGPWSVAPRHGESEYWINARAWTQLASVYSTEDLLSDPEAEANAKLIAAAPTLADALEAVRAQRTGYMALVDAALVNAGRIVADALKAQKKDL